MSVEFEEFVRVRQEKFGAVVFETLSEKVFVTNETGAEILRLIGEGNKRDEIVAKLIRDYNSDPRIIEREVDEFILLLKENRIVKS